MKKIFALFILLLIPCVCYAKVSPQNANKLPQGVFKKTWNGDVVQYDNKGKKLHTYKMKNNKVVKIK